MCVTSRWFQGSKSSPSERASHLVDTPTATPISLRRNSWPEENGSKGKPQSAKTKTEQTRRTLLNRGTPTIMGQNERDESYCSNLGRRTHLSVLPSFSNAGSADTRVAFKVTASIAAKLSA